MGGIYKLRGQLRVGERELAQLTTFLVKCSTEGKGVKNMLNLTTLFMDAPLTYKPQVKDHFGCSRDNLRLLINIDDRINIALTTAYKSRKNIHSL